MITLVLVNLAVIVLVLFFLFVYTLTPYWTYDDRWCCFSREREKMRNTRCEDLTNDETDGRVE